MSSTTNTRRWIEIASVLFIAAMKFVFMDWLKTAWQFVLAVIVVCVCYILGRKNVDQSIPIKWGFRWDNFKVVGEV